MDLQVIKTGRVFFGIDPQVGALLIEAGIATKHQTPVPAPPSQSWEYFCGLTPGGVHSVQRRRGFGELEFCPTGDPTAVGKFWPDCPRSVIAQFAATPLRERVRGGPVVVNSTLSTLGTDFQG